MIINTDLIYPIGAIYLSVSATNPSTLFGGKWELIEDRFLLGAGGNYAPRIKGGSKTHNHNLSRKGGANFRKYGNTFYQGDYTSAGTMPSQSKDGYWWLTTGNTDTSSSTNPGEKGIGVGLYGTTDDKDILPPYYTVYMWERVA